MNLVVFGLVACCLASASMAFQPFHLPQRKVQVRSRLAAVPPIFVSYVDYSDLLLRTRVQELERLEAIAKNDAIAAGLISASNLTTGLSQSSRPKISAPSFPVKESKQAIPEQLQTESSLNGDPLGSFRPQTSNSKNNATTSLEGGDLVCRVVALRDSKLPEVTDALTLPDSLVDSPTNILQRLDDIYHAQAHQETRFLKYMQRSVAQNVAPVTMDTTSTTDSFSEDDAVVVCESQEEEDVVVMTLRNSLEDAGFERLTRRDLDLCEALNAGYLLRLSILPDVSKLDPSIAEEFYPEFFDEEGRPKDREKLAEQLLFDGRVLVYWRGYSKEVTRGRLLLPKIDYLQASLVQRLSGSVRRRFAVTERFLVMKSLVGYRKITACFIHYLREIADAIPNEGVTKGMRKRIRSPYTYSAYKALSNSGRLPTLADLRAAASDSTLFKLSRYGGSKIKFVGSPNPTDALNPFIICEENSDECLLDEEMCGDSRAAMVDRDMYESLNNNGLRCPYDASNPRPPRTSFQLLDRVSISSLVDVFTREGRRNLVRTIFSKSELVEPTYEEVVVVWRPLPDKPDGTPRFAPPQFAYDVADMFDIDGLPEKPKDPPKPVRKPLEIRTFEGVPMANLPAVLPKTKLVFRPADAFVFDLVSIVSFLAIAGSLRFDNPKLDFIALVSVSLWLIRTVFRYSNKLARYDLLVKKFLTSKISHRNSGALKYLATQAGSQRATRAALVHKWLCSLSKGEEPLARSRLIALGKGGVNALIDDLKETPVDVDAALNDLEDVGLVERTDEEGRYLRVLRDDKSIVRTLNKAWRSIFEGRASLRTLIGRRGRSGKE